MRQGSWVLFIIKKCIFKFGQTAHLLPNLACRPFIEKQNLLNMKLRGSLFFSLIIGALVLGAAYLPSTNNADKETVLIQTIIEGLNQLHYAPQKINDDFSGKAYKLYLDRVDGARRWLTKSDVEQLEGYELRLDDEVNAANYEFFNKSVELLKAGRTKSQGYYREILEKPFDFDKEEDYEFGKEDKPFAKDDTELYEYWRKVLKYETLTRLSTKLKEQSKSEEVDAKSFEELEKEAREATLETFDKWYDQISKDKRSDFLNNYLNAITNVYDPHTGYFLPKDKENFDISMSGTLEGIGARLQTDGEFTKVISIVTGGPAWKQKELETDDLITKVSQEGEEPVDVTGFRIDDVVKLIRGKKGTTVMLTVKKIDGSMQDIPIERDVVIMEEGYAKSAIINLENVTDNVGYIRLPRFYADFNRRGGRSCATDIAKEIEKLKAENVKGIILDLRDNGGGSLRDVVKMSGLFIEEGPIVQVKARGRNPEILEDNDSRVQYDGDLIVMVNSYSASASEILAAALQDYGRAVIIGAGESTFGKGTVQRFFDLDRAIRDANEVKPLGEVKLTIQKFYRVNGGSTQLKGVVPDIVLPNRFTYIDTGEKQHDFPMEWTEIEPVSYSQEVTKLDNLPALKAASMARVSNHETFKLVDESAKYLKEQRESSSFSLNLKNFEAQKLEREKIADKYDDMMVKIEGLAVTNLPGELEKLADDESKTARNEEWLKNLSKDIYLEEALHVMKDMKK